MSEKRLNILYLAHRIPFPPNKGDKIRSYHQLRHLAAEHQVDLVCLADNPEEVRFRGDLEKLCRRVHIHPFRPLTGKVRGLARLTAGGTISVGYFYRGEVQQIVDRWLQEKDYDAVVCFSSTIAEYVFRSASLARLSRRPRLVMDFCDVDSDKWIQYSRESGFPLKYLYRTEGERLLAYEGEINRRFDHSVFISEKEADLFKGLYPAARNLEVIQNGVDFEYFDPFFCRNVHSDNEHSRSDGFSATIHPAQPSNRPMLLFTGAMDYHANVDGVSWFCDEIFPSVRAELDASEFYIVGSNPAQRVRELGGRDGVKVTGFVEDIRPYYQAADVSVIPLRLARGVQNKVLEAMAMGKAVVTTSKAAAGIQVRADEHVLVEDTAEGFARAVVELFRDSEVRAQLGENARRFVTERFDWGANMSRLAALLPG